MSVLAVVDMQPGFDASKKCLDGVLALVEKSMRHNIPIVIVELDSESYGATHAPITYLLRGYKKQLYVSKWGNDGSEEIQRALSSNLDYKLKLDKFRVCGVNANCCVKDTALGLARKYTTSEVIVHHEASCGTSCEIQTDLNTGDWYWFGYNVHKLENIYICKGDRLYNPKHDLVRVAA